MSPLQIAILETIRANDGKLSWYQLDRKLTQRAGGVDPKIVSTSLMPALRELEESGSIVASKGHNPSQPLYAIAPRGRQQLEEERGEDKMSDENPWVVNAIQTPNEA